MGDDGKMTFEWKQANPEAARKAEVQAVHDRLARAIPPDRKARRPELAAVTVDTLRDVVAGQAVYIRNLENMVFHWEAIGQAALNEVADLEKHGEAQRVLLSRDTEEMIALRRSLSDATEQLATQGRAIVEKNTSLNDVTASLNYLRSRVNTLAAENERLHRALKRKRAPHG